MASSKRMKNKDQDAVKMTSSLITLDMKEEKQQDSEKEEQSIVPGMQVLRMNEDSRSWVHALGSKAGKRFQRVEQILNIAKDKR